MAARDRRYEIVDIEGLDAKKEIGRGCYGAVYEVRVNGVPCIAKRLHDILVGRGGQEPVGAEQRAGAISKFRQECDLLSTLRHPNVVQFMGVHYGRDDDEADISLIMEYMHMDLEHCMKTYPNIPFPYKTRILRDVAYGLAYLHSIPIIHRDLNTGNVLLTESLRAKIADLGVAKLFETKVATKRTRTACPGAPDFMPPESLSHLPKYSDKLDVFSFGHLAIYLINQEAPHVEDSTISLQDAENQQVQVGKRRESLMQMGGSCHPLYATIVQCLSDNLDQRPTSRDLVRRMEELCDQNNTPHKNVLETLKHQITEAEKYKTTSEEQAEEHKRKVEELNREVEERKREVEELKREADILGETIININQSLNDSNQVANMKQKVIDECDQSIADLTNKLGVAEAEAQTYKKDFEQERRDREIARGELDTLKGRLAKLEKKKKKSCNSDLVAENEQLKQQLEKAKKALNASRHEMKEALLVSRCEKETEKKKDQVKIERLNETIPHLSQVIQSQSENSVPLATCHWSTTEEIEQKRNRERTDSCSDRERTNSNLDLEPVFTCAADIHTVTLQARTEEAPQNEKRRGKVENEKPRKRCFTHPNIILPRPPPVQAKPTVKRTRHSSTGYMQVSLPTAAAASQQPTLPFHSQAPYQSERQFTEEEQPAVEKENIERMVPFEDKSRREELAHESKRPVPPPIKPRKLKQSTSHQLIAQQQSTALQQSTAQQQPAVSRQRSVTDADQIQQTAPSTAWKTISLLRPINHQPQHPLPPPTTEDLQSSRSMPITAVPQQFIPPTTAELQDPQLRRVAPRNAVQILPAAGPGNELYRKLSERKIKNNEDDF